MTRRARIMAKKWGWDN